MTTSLGGLGAGRITAKIVPGKRSSALFSDQVVFIGGRPTGYRELAKLVENIVRKPFQKTL